MISFLYSEKSCTLYKNYKFKNTGSDEILELENTSSENGASKISRILIKFNLSSIEKDLLLNKEYFLNLKVTQKTELENKSKIEIFPICGDWEEGKGRFGDHEVDYSGASWQYRNSNLNEWIKPDTSINNQGGGAWYSKVMNSSGEEEEINVSGWFTNEFSDLRINVTEIVNYWLYYGLENNGFIIKYHNEDEIRSGNVKFYSRTTNTIYYPYLEVCTDDYEFDTKIKNPKSANIHSGSLDSGSLYSGSLDSGSLDSGSLDSGSLDSGSLDSGSLDSGSLDSVVEINDYILSPKLIRLDGDELLPKIKMVKKEYKHNSQQRIKVTVREKYQRKKFTNRSEYDKVNFTNQNLFYSVRDAETEEIIVDFGSFTKISCNKDGHYFMFDFGCLNVGRLYKFLIKIENEYDSSVFLDDRTFKVVY